MNFIKIPVLPLRFLWKKYGKSLGAMAELAFHKFASGLGLSASQSFRAALRQILATPPMSSVPRVTSV